MPAMPPTHRADGRSSREAGRRYDQARDATPKRQLYDSAWALAAKAFLSANPLCRYCAPHDKAATLVDHFWPHRGDRALFWRREFWVASCDECHNGMKQAVERRGRAALLALAARIGIGAP